MDVFIKNMMMNVRNVKKQMKPVEYYRLLEKILMIINAELNDRPAEIEDKKE